MRFYFRNSSTNATGITAADQSAAMTANVSNAIVRDLSETIGPTSGTVDTISGPLAMPVVTTRIRAYFGKWATAPLTGITTLNAQTWQFVLVGNESVSTEQQFFTAVGYVVRADGTIRGFAFDSDVEHGTEIPTVAAGRSFQIAGSAVAGIVATDRLVIEVWSQGAPSSAVACNMRFRYDGNTVPADLVANSNAASYVESAQAGLFDAAPPPPLDSTTLYFRATQDNVDIHTTAEFSSMTPLDRLTQAHDLQLQPGTAVASQTLLGSANTVAFNTYLGKFLSPTLGVATIPAGTWEIGSVLVEDAGGANRFLALSVYVVKADDTVRGYVYDSPTALGPEAQITPIASVDTFTGAAVTGIISTDRLVVEVWTSTPGQDAANVRRQTFTYDGTTTIVDGVANASPRRLHRRARRRPRLDRHRPTRRPRRRHPAARCRSPRLRRSASAPAAQPPLQAR